MDSGLSVKRVAGSEQNDERARAWDGRWLHLILLKQNGGGPVRSRVFRTAPSSGNGKSARTLSIGLAPSGTAARGVHHGPPVWTGGDEIGACGCLRQLVLSRGLQGVVTDGFKLQQTAT